MTMTNFPEPCRCARRRVAAALAVVAAVLFAGPGFLVLIAGEAVAQTGTRGGSVVTTQPQRAGQSGTTGEPFVEAAETIQVPSIGLSMRVPNGARVTIEPQSTRRVLIQASGDRWVSSIDVKRTLDTTLTIEQVTDILVDAMDLQVSQAEPPARRRLTVGGSPAEEIRMRLARMGGLSPTTGRREIASQEVRIYTVIRSAPGTFLIHTFYCDAGFATEAVAEHNQLIASIQFTDASVLAEQRDDALSATATRLAAIDASAYRAVVGEKGEDRFYRVFRRTAEGRDEEIGYFRVQARIGQRGAVDRNMDPRRFQGVEQEEGLLVRFTGRYVASDPDTGAAAHEIIDIESDAWVGFDRRNEMWSVRQARYVHDNRLKRYRQAPPSVVTGARRDGRIVLSVSGFNEEVEPSIMQRPPRSYIAQAELQVLYKLLAPLSEGTTFGMFVVDSARGDMEYRVETVLPSTTEGRTFIKSQRNQDSEPDTKTIDASGTLLRIVRPNGEITALSNPEEIQRLWQSKNLPTGSMADVLAGAPADGGAGTGSGTSGTRRQRQSR